MHTNLNDNLYNKTSSYGLALNRRLLLSWFLDAAMNKWRVVAIKPMQILGSFVKKSVVLTHEFATNALSWRDFHYHDKRPDTMTTWNWNKEIDTTSIGHMNKQLSNKLAVMF